MTPKFYSLLFIDLEEKRQLFGKEHTAEERLTLFLKNAATLDLSLKQVANIPDGLTILTNRKDTVDALLKKISYEGLVNVEVIEFSLNVPKGIRFYSAHYKIDAFKYLASRPNDEYSILLDNDIVAIREFPNTFKEIVNKGIPMCYYICEEDPDVSMSSCRKVSPQISPVQWTGGEFWAGKNSFFAKLYSECTSIAPNYFKVLNESLCHIGDEMLTSIALTNIWERANLQILDASNLNFIRRYWGYHESTQISKYNPVLAHLPADKVWVAAQFNAQKEFKVKEFIIKYEKHIRLMRFLSVIRKLVKR